jgi:hypothetical protein
MIYLKVKSMDKNKIIMTLLLVDEKEHFIPSLVLWLTWAMCK